MLEWIGNYLGDAAAFLLLGSGLIELVPIRINPWSFVFKKSGHAVNGEVISKVNDLSEALDKHVQADERREAREAREKILRFCDETLEGRRHSQEHFNEVLDDITEYKRYCDEHPDFPNDKAVLAIERVEQIYRKCLEENDFL